jgi:hypothetical protein
MEVTNRSHGMEPTGTPESSSTRRKLYERPVVIDWGSVAQLTGGVNVNPGDFDDLDGSQPL